MPDMQKRPINECMSTTIEMVDENCLVADAVDIMREKNIGSVLVRGPRGSFGIFTERDFLRKVNLRDMPKKDLLSVRINEDMATDLQTVNHGEPYENVIRLMQSRKIRHMPVVKGKKIVGIVSLRDLMAYHEKQLKEINRQITDSAAQLAAKTSRLNAIIDLAAELVSDMEPKQLLKHITRVARDLVRADTASVILLKEDGGQLTVATSEFAGKPPEQKVSVPPLDKNKSITGWVIKNRQPLLLQGKVTDDKRFKNMPCNEDVKSSICIPLIYRGAIKGTLNLTITRTDYIFTQEDLETAITLANLVSVTLENSSMYKDLQAMYLRSLRVANERMNKMNEELRIANEKIDNEIKTVAIVQQGLLPSALPHNKKVDMAAIYSASTLVGGDYYDCIQMEDGKLALVIADVTGHGLPAAFVMTMVKILLFYLNQQKIPIDQTVTTINDMFSCHIPISTFPSMIYGILDPEEQTLTYINAGHEPMVLLNPHTKRRELHYAKSSLLGIETGTRFITDTIRIEKGDRLLLYTDGIPDAMNKDKESFTRERFIEVASRNAAKNPKEIVDAIINEVNTFCQGIAFTDDITLMVLGF